MRSTLSGRDSGAMDLTSVRAVAAATPITRNKVVDLLRVVAILVVVLGHWLVAAVWVESGELRTGAVLDIAPWTHPLTWIFQVMPIFFLVGGYANALSWRSARRRDIGYAGWLRSRLARLLTPVVPLLLTWVVLCTVALRAGVPGATLRTASQVALVPTWFLAAYVVVCAVAPATLWLWERVGWASIVGGLALGGLVDLSSIGAGVQAIGFANYVLVWASVHQLGYAWLDGRLRGTGRRLSLAVVGAVGLLVLVVAGPYPVSMIGLDGATINNSYPTRVTLGFLGLLQAGIVLALEPALARWLRRPLPWRATVLVTARIMTIYLWHLTVMVLVIGVALLLGGAGLGAEPLSGDWWVGRPLWWGVLGVVTLGVVAVVGRFEPARSAVADQPAVWRPVVATMLACGGLGLMAKQGIVSTDGVHWWWPALPVVALALVHPLSARRSRHDER
ncbi:MAG: acyltransferase [Ornithinibacter sp.]